jgi:carboxyl-terminal processing protease
VNSPNKRGILGVLAATLALGATGAVLMTRPGSAQNAQSSTPENVAGTIAARQPGAVGPIEGALIPAAEASSRPVPKPANAQDNIKIAKFVSQMLTSSHYSRHPLDDEMSAKFLDTLLDNLDPQHLYFQQADVAEFEKYRTTLDDLTLKGDTSPAEVIIGRFKERVEQNVAYATEALKTEKFDFTGNESILIDREKEPRPASPEEAKKLWLNRLRFEYLQEKLAGQKPEEITKKLTTRYSRLGRAIREWDGDDVIEQYLNSLTLAYDPHSDYMGRASAANFRIRMNQGLFGIGANLQSEDGYTKIVELIPGGPAERSKQLKPGDRIVAVGQGTTGEPVDVVDMKIDRVVEQIRGNKGTTVRLVIIPGDAKDDSTRKTVTLVRDEIRLEEQTAKGRLVEMPGPDGKMVRVGVIELNFFYQDPEKGKSATGDVEILIKKLKQEGATGLILDLRKNPGGLLTEAVSLTGLFIKEGTVVQVKSYNGTVRPDADEDPSVAWDGPLVVLTSRLSASASEIVAGALQDYGRAVIVGDPSTFGKGTVQAVVPLGQAMRSSGMGTTEDPGSLTLTVQKFYRASGSSTQLEGVKPDIILPSTLAGRDIGEKSYSNPLPWDTIETAKFTKSNQVSQFLPELRRRSEARIAADKGFTLLKEMNADSKKLLEQKTISLNEAKRKTEREQDQARVKTWEKDLAARGPGKEKIYPLTLKDAAKPGLPAPLTVKQLNDQEKKKTPDPDGDASDTSAAPERDIVLEETQRTLLDFVLLTRKQSGGITAR